MSGIGIYLCDFTVFGVCMVLRVRSLSGDWFTCAIGAQVHFTLDVDQVHVVPDPVDTLLAEGYHYPKVGGCVLALVEPLD